MNIYEKMLAIMHDVQRLQKDDHVKFGQTSYKALSEEKVTTIMREKMLQHGLVVYPIQQTSNRSGNITHVDVVYRMVNVENPEEYIEIASAGDGADTQDKGSGKAMTYAYKYMWLRTFALPTGEDPDKISSEELDAKEAEASREILCTACGEPLRPVTKKDGSIWTVEDQAVYSGGTGDNPGRFGRVLCGQCMKLALRAEKANGV